MTIYIQMQTRTVLYQQLNRCNVYQVDACQRRTPKGVKNSYENICYFFPRYFLSHHNVIDFLAICSIIFAGVLSNVSFYYGHEHSKHKLNEVKVIFSSIGCCLTWMMCLQLGLSCNRCVGIQLSMVEKMMSDVLHITGVMLLFITAFASFLLLCYTMTFHLHSDLLQWTIYTIFSIVGRLFIFRGFREAVKIVLFPVKYCEIKFVEC